MLPRRLAGPAGLLLVLAMAGCSGQPKVVARVGPRTVTVDDFLAAARGSQASYPGPPDSAKAHLLDDLVKRTLVLCAADERGLFKDSVITNFRRLKEEEFLVQAMARRLTPASVPVSEGEIEQLYAWRDSVAHLQAIYLFSRPAAQLALSEIRRTGDFTAVANRYNPTGSLPPNGDLGDQAPGALIQPLDRIVRTARPGEVVGPVQAMSQGWFILRVLERKARPQPPFESQKPLLTEMLQQRKQRMAAIENHLRLREAYALELVPGGSQMIFAHANPSGGSPPAYLAQDFARPLARWVEPGGPRTYTFGDALGDLSTGGREKPNSSVLPAIDEWVLSEAERRIQITEARRRGIADDLAFRRMLDETVNGYVLDGIYNQEVVARAAPSPEDARELFERSRASFEKLESVTLDVVDFPDSTSAIAFASHGSHASSLRSAVAMTPGTPPVQTVEISFPTPDLDWTQMQGTLAAMHEGDALGPFPVRGGAFRAFQVLARKVNVPTYESLDPETRARIDQGSIEVARERRLNEFVEGLRSHFKTELRPESLRKLPWPVTTAGS